MRAVLNIDLLFANALTWREPEICHFQKTRLIELTFAGSWELDRDERLKDL